MMEVLYVIADIDRAIPFEWIWDSFRSKRGVNISFCFIGQKLPQTMKILENRGATTIYLRCDSKWSWPLTLWRLIRVYRKMRPDAIHCHLLSANILGLIAGAIISIKTRVYTRHHSIIHHSGCRKGIIWDYISNSLATHIVSISQSTTYALNKLEKVALRKLYLIPHGIPIDEIELNVRRRKGRFCARYNISQDKFIIGVISRPVEWKGIRHIVEAFAKLLETYGTAKYHFVFMGGYVHNGGNPIVQYIRQMLPRRTYTLIDFEQDIYSVYADIDVLVHCPVDARVEAFGQVYIEAIASGTPMLCTLSGVAAEILVENVNAMVVDYGDASKISEGLHVLSSNKKLVDSLTSNAKMVLSEFRIELMVERLLKLYTGDLPSIDCK